MLLLPFLVYVALYQAADSKHAQFPPTPVHWHRNPQEKVEAELQSVSLLIVKSHSHEGNDLRKPPQF